MDYEFSVAQCTHNADVKELLIFIASRCILNFTLIHSEWELLISLSNRVTFSTTVVSNVHVTTSFRLICIHCGVLLEKKGRKK